MRKVKWIFLAYLGLVVLIVVGMAVSFGASTPRDPHTLYLPLIANVRTLDPAEVNDTISAPLVGTVYETLYNYKYGSPSYEMYPEIAAEMPQLSPDRKVMTIKIRAGIHFYDPSGKLFPPNGDGPEITSRDVIYTFKRICNFKLASANYSAVFQGMIAGLDDWWDYTKNTPADKVDWERPVSGFEIVDPYTIRLHLTSPNPQMIFRLGYEPTGIVCREAIERLEKLGKPFRWNPVGSAAYGLDEYLADQRIVFKANPFYRGRPDIDGTHALAKDDPARMPHIPRVQYDFFLEQLPTWLLFQQGLFDSLIEIPKDSIHLAIRDEKLAPELAARGARLDRVPEPSIDYIAFNLQDPILGKNKPLRQAMSMAFDRQAYLAFEQGRGEAATGLIPHGMPGYDPNWQNPYCQLNLPRARELMKEAIRIQGGPIPPLQLLMRDADTLSRQMADFFVTQMRQIGVELRPEYRDFARWGEMVDNRQGQIFDAGWQSDYPDQQDFFQTFYSKNIPDAGLDWTCYNNPKFDALYEQASQMEDSPQRQELYRQMAHMLDEDCPAIWVYYRTLNIMHYDWIGDFSWMQYGLGSSRQYFTLDSPLRERRFKSGAFRH